MGCRDADDFNPDADGKLTAPRVTDKWDGEDEDNDINDAWDAESDVDKDDSKKKQGWLKFTVRRTEEGGG